MARRREVLPDIRGPPEFFGILSRHAGARWPRVKRIGLEGNRADPTGGRREARHQFARYRCDARFLILNDQRNFLAQLIPRQPLPDRGEYFIGESLVRACHRSGQVKAANHRGECLDCSGPSGAIGHWDGIQSGCKSLDIGIEPFGEGGARVLARARGLAAVSQRSAAGRRRVTRPGRKIRFDIVRDR